MQDKTINVALLLLRAPTIRGDGEGLAHVEVLLVLPRVSMPPVWPGRLPGAARRGHMARLILKALRAGSKTRAELAALVRADRSALGQVDAGYCTDKALTKLRLAGRAVRMGEWVWRVCLASTLRRDSSCP